MPNHPTAEQEVIRLKGVLKRIAEYCGSPIPLDSGYRTVARKWMDDCHAVQNIARTELGMCLLVRDRVSGE